MISVLQGYTDMIPGDLVIGSTNLVGLVKLWGNRREARVCGSKVSSKPVIAYYVKLNFIV
jgi:hypothetical protein